MKKLLTVIVTVLILSIMLSLVGCGKQAASSVELIINTPSSQAAVPVKEAAPTPAPTPTPEPVSAAESASAAESVSASVEVEAASNSTEKVEHTPATAGLPVLPVLGLLLVACLYGLVREMRKKY